MLNEDLKTKSLITTRIFRVCPVMPYLNLFQKTLKGTETFRDIQQIYEKENLYFPKGWLKSNQCKDYLVENVIYGDMLSQMTWALENNFENLLSRENFLEEVLLKQISNFKADIVFFNTGALYRVNKEARNNIRKNCTSVKAIIGSWGDQLPPNESYVSYLGDLDFIFSCTVGYYDDIKKEGLNTIYCPSSFNEYISYEKTEKNIDVSFIGTTGYLQHDHFERFIKLNLIFKLLLKKQIKFVLVAHEINASILSILSKSLFFIYPASYFPVILLRAIRKFARILKAGKLENWINLIISFKRYKFKYLDYERFLRFDKTSVFLKMKKLTSKFKKHSLHPFLFASEYYSALAKSKIVINLHRDEDNDVGNIRCFEVTGVGSCLLTDRADKLVNLFTEEEEIIGFQTAEECVRKIEQLLK
ncbi:MAG: glycosyltransferase family 1 protein, partial [Candidatus Staskawiczbacteria bacterium]|nr:glycosyltransferase family 1 protein [Candidatus Staskawiczbacteria bacterium]